MIGIVSAPIPISQQSCSDSYLYTQYINWIELSGETAIIIKYDIPKKELLTLLHRVQGVVWVGGAITNKKTHTKKQSTTLFDTLYTIYTFAILQNNKGNYYPLWGTCLGFEILLSFGENITIEKYKKNGMSTCTLHESRLKKWFPKIQEKMKATPCVYHNHYYGYRVQPLKNARIVSLQDNFINAIEFIDYPFYGVQFHPEHPTNDFSLEVSTQFSLFFKNECSKNKNIWKWDPTDFKKERILI